MSEAALDIAPLREDEVEAVVSLWQRCGLTRPWNNPRADIAFAMRGPNSTILAGRIGAKVVATVMVGHDGHRGWFYYLCVDPDEQKRGHGRAITAAAEAWLRGRDVSKAMLMVRPENTTVQGFYESMGYSVQPRTILNKWLDGRDPTP